MNKIRDETMDEPQSKKENIYQRIYRLRNGRNPRRRKIQKRVHKN